jgi:hypothetical protein
VCKAGQLPYYAGTVAVGAGASVLAVPVLEGPHLRGSPVRRSRAAVRGGTDRELLPMRRVDQLLRTVQAEQVFRAVERAKYEHERFFLATAMLGRALTPEQVMETAFDACAAIADYDAAVITLYDRDARRAPGRRRAHRRARRRASIDPRTAARPRVQGQRRPGRDGGQEPPLPAGRRRAARGHRADVYTRKIKLDDARSLLVLPLLARRRGRSAR